METFQQIRVKVNDMTAAPDRPLVIRINAQTKKDYKFIKGLYVSMPNEYMHHGAYMSLKIGQVELFEDHETKLLSCGFNVAPNDMFLRLGYNIEAAGSELEGKLTITQSSYGTWELILYLWLTNAAE